MLKFTEPETFVATSGNVCTWRYVKYDAKLFVDAHWKRKESDHDREEFMEYFHLIVLKGADSVMSHADHGKGDRETRRRQATAFEEFMRTGSVTGATQFKP